MTNTTNKFTTKKTTEPYPLVGVVISVVFFVVNASSLITNKIQ